MSAAAIRNPDSTLILLRDRDLLPVGTPPPPPLRLTKSCPAPVKLGIRAHASARESGVVHFRFPTDPGVAPWSGSTDERPANDPPSASASVSAALDTSMLPRDLSATAASREPAVAGADAMQVVLLVMAIAVLSAVASVLVHLSAAQ